MIIVKTKNGDRFINEAETLQVNHIKDKKTAEVWPSKCGNQQQEPQFYVIEDVESIMYVNAAQPTQWMDEGSDVERLRQTSRDKTLCIARQARQLKVVKDDLLHFVHNMYEIVSYHHEEVPKDIRDRIQKSALELKSKVLNEEYRNIQ